MMRTRAFAAAMAASCCFGCAHDPAPIDLDELGSLDDEFARAAERDHIPVDLLKAMSYVETRWDMVVGEDEYVSELTGELAPYAAGHGLFALAGDNLTRGAEAAGVSIDAARFEVPSHLAAVGARLAELARQRGVSGDDLMAWQSVIGDFAQTDDSEARQEYIDEVLRVLAAGAAEYAEDGTLVATLVANPTVTARPRGAGGARATVDFPGAMWRSSPNYNSRNGSGVSLVVIHSCEGKYSACWSWLRNTQAQASAHYVVNEDGSEVSQLVRESNRAWHVAARFDCTKAGNTQCDKDGMSTNTFSVGIEHAGFASQKSWSNGIIEKSAKLTCDITRDHGIPRDRNHIVSHGQLQPANRTDPGPNWPWSQYIDRVRELCGDGGGGGGSSIIVDSNNANNNQSVARIELAAGGAWQSSSGTPGYYGTGYWYAQTAESSAPATFWFYTATAGSHTIDGWWTAGTNRSSAATFVGYNAAGSEVGRRAVDQRASGSQWVSLGTWNFSAGWNKVVLSRWGTAGSVVIADAIRVR